MEQTKEKRIAELEMECQRLKRQVNAQHHELLDLHERYDVLYAEYNTILNSQCWKITAPFRKAVDKAKDNKYGKLIYKGLWSVKNLGIKETRRRVERYFRVNRKIEVQHIEHIDSFCNLAVQFGKKNNRLLSKVYSEKKLAQYDELKEKKVLIVSHELDLTGAPVALRYLAHSISEEGYLPVFVSPHDGSLSQELVADQIPAIVCPSIFSSDIIDSFLQLFDLVIVSTIVGAPVIQHLGGTGIPTMWWIHEAAVSYTENAIAAMPHFLTNNIAVYAGGEYAQRMLNERRPYYRAKQLLYYTPDKAVNREAKEYPLPAQAHGKTVFCMIGMLEQRKGQDIFVDALLSLEESRVKEGYYVFVGKQCFKYNYDRVMEFIHKYPDNSMYIEEVNSSDLLKLYQRMDCLVCASRDDPMPIVVTEAMEFSKLVICSENTGSAKLIEQGNAGFVYRNNDPLELAECVEQVLGQAESFSAMREAARKVYERYFSYPVFRKRILQAIEDVQENGDDAGKPFSKLVKDFDWNCAEEDVLEGRDALKRYDQEKRRRILLISHEFSLTGAPKALLNLACSLKRRGFQVLVVSPFRGGMEQNFSAEKIPYAVYTNLYQDDFLESHASSFDLVVLCTVVTFRAVSQLEKTNVPVLWWIHDSEASYSMGGFATIMPKELPENVTVACGGEYARTQLLKYYPKYAVRCSILNYYVPDKSKEAKSYPVYDMKRKPGKLTFTVLGLQDYRKGHDILAKAIELLSDEKRSGCEFYFIGRKLDVPIYEAISSVCQRYPENVHYITEVNERELCSVYMQSDCIVCSSRDDPLPVFVAEAMQFSKMIICSENTGFTRIIEEENCGLLYRNNDPIDLKNQIEYVIDHDQELADIRSNARRAYRKHFTMQAFESNMLRQIESVLEDEDEFKGTVSVVIPAYNAGDSFEQMLQLLRNQKKIRKMEIVVVDSGSTDHTIGLCRKYGVVLKQITQQEFSHSYARNLGAFIASGEILLVMTQDAMPTDELWAYKMIKPIVDGEAAATSCTEKCPDGTDLYYKINSWNHARYLGVDRQDRLNELLPSDSLEELRKKGSLNDVSSAIRTDVFRRYLYRNSYAEDLDLGIRLLKDGLRVKLLGSVKVSHGHNRSAGYYVKRAYAEAHAFEKIDARWQSHYEKEKDVVSKIVYGSRCFERIMGAARELPATYGRKEFFDGLKEIMTRKWRENGQASLQSDIRKDPVLRRCYELAEEYAHGEAGNDAGLLYSLIAYFDIVIVPYFEENAVAYSFDMELREEILHALLKHFALLVGQQMACIRPEEKLYAQVKTLGQGV